MSRRGNTAGDRDDNPYPLYPQHGGLLAWGLTQDADYLFWRTDDGDPDGWPVVVWLRQAEGARHWTRTRDWNG